MNCLLRTIVISALAVPIGFSAAPFQFNIQDVQKELALAQDQPGARIVIINPADRMNEEAANAFLKQLVKLHLVWKVAFSLLVVIAITYLSWQALLPLYRQDYRNEPLFWQKISNVIPSDGKTIAMTQDYGFRVVSSGSRVDCYLAAHL
jgi:hypothetical protein